ncbi:GntR family transcriptional regulator (plasmid) [Kribbella sp. WER1]
MARYREIAEDLRQRIGAREFTPGQQLPPIAALQAHYNVPGLNTIRQAQQLLVDDGLVETRQGVGVFVLRTDPLPRTVDVLAELRAARSAINLAITALEKAEQVTTPKEPDRG